MQTDAITVGQLTSFLVYLAYAGISVGGTSRYLGIDFLFLFCLCMWLYVFISVLLGRSPVSVV